MDKKEFIARWKRQLAGLIATGHPKARIILVGCFTGGATVEKFLEELEVNSEQFIARMIDDWVKNDTTNERTRLPEPAKETAQPIRKGDNGKADTRGTKAAN